MAKVAAKPTKPASRVFTYAASLAIAVDKNTEEAGAAFVRSELQSLATHNKVTSLTVTVVELTGTGCARCGQVKPAAQLVTVLKDRYCLTCIGDLIQNEG